MTELKGKYFRVLDKGFIGLVDIMGSDAAIEQAARVSYGEGTRPVSSTRALIRYLMRQNHCYHPSMQVLTDIGWKRWDECKDEENFIVPDENGNYKIERLKLLKFEYTGRLMTYNTNKMSYIVTPNHKMYFKPKYQCQYQLIDAGDIPKWGHFRPIKGYKLFNNNNLDVKKYNLYQFLGFYLGDGFQRSTNAIVFRLKRKRKIQYLETLLQNLGIEYKLSLKTHSRPGLVYEYSISLLQTVLDIDFDWKQKAKTKHYRNIPLIPEAIYGVLDGLINSDGSRKCDREQIEFSSVSTELVRLFELLSALTGNEAHKVKRFDTYNAKQYFGVSNTLESRKQYHDTIEYSGDVFCTTSSTGLLVVRGDETKFAFICGNSSPLEMVEMKFHIKCPIFVMRQLVRHRTANLNEESGRYSIIKNECYTPSREQYTLQSTDNKQGRSSTLIDDDIYSELLANSDEVKSLSFTSYQKQLEGGVSRELARINLPLSTYTSFYWKMDLRNLLHFMGLRCDSHAQYEIRAYSNIIAGFVKEICPIAFEGWYDYTFQASTLTLLDKKLLTYLLNYIYDINGSWMFSQECFDTASIYGESIGMSKREIVEFFDKVYVPYEQDFSLDLHQSLTSDEIQLDNQP